MLLSRLPLRESYICNRCQNHLRVRWSDCRFCFGSPFIRGAVTLLSLAELVAEPLVLNDTAKSSVSGRNVPCPKWCLVLQYQQQKRAYLVCPWVLNLTCELWDCCSLMLSCGKPFLVVWSGQGEMLILTGTIHGSFLKRNRLRTWGQVMKNGERTVSPIWEREALKKTE